MGVKTKDLISPNLKRIEGSVVEYPPVGSQEAPQTIIVKEKFKSQILNHNPSQQWLKKPSELIGFECTK